MLQDELVAKAPRRATDAELRRVGVERDLHRDGSFTCLNCGQEWQPTLRRGGLYPRGYWKCPEGCNANADQRPKMFGVRLPEALINQVKIAAAQQRVSVKALVTEVLTKHLRAEKNGEEE